MQSINFVIISTTVTHPYKRAIAKLRFEKRIHEDTFLKKHSYMVLFLKGD